MGKSGKSDNEFGFGVVWVVWGPMFIANIFKRIALLHFGLVTFGFHFGRIMKPIISMVFGFSDVSMIPQTNYVYFQGKQNTPNNQDSQIILKVLKVIILGNLKLVEPFLFLKIMERAGTKQA